MFREKYATVFDGDDRWRSLPSPDGRAVRVGRRLDLHPQPAVLRRADAEAGAADRHRRRARARGARRQRDDRSHLAGRFDSGGQPGGQVPDLEGRAARGLQLLRRAPRQPRSDDARHVRQHPPAQPARAGHRGRLDDAAAGGRRDDDLRRVGALPRRGVPLLVIAGKEYGSGSSRDWAAKGTLLLGVKAVIAESFERIHRSNLVNMGVLPLSSTPARTPPR